MNELQIANPGSRAKKINTDDVEWIGRSCLVR